MAGGDGARCPPCGRQVQGAFRQGGSAAVAPDKERSGPFSFHLFSVNQPFNNRLNVENRRCVQSTGRSQAGCVFQGVVGKVF